MSNKIVRLLALDIYGTLFDVIAGLTALMTRMEIPDAGKAARGWVKRVQSETRTMTSPASYQPFLSVILAALDAELDERKIGVDEASREGLLRGWLTLEPFPDARPALERWRDLGAVAWVVTDADLDSVQMLLERTGLSGLVGGVVTAAAVQVCKPAAEIYEQLSTSAGVLPAQVAVGSALQADIAGAHAAGMRAGWVRREADGLTKTGSGPDWTAPGLQELVDMLQPLLPRPVPGEQVW